MNLLTNAIKYSPKTDKILVTTKVKGSSVITGIQDFGIGIAKEYHHKIFERFFRITDMDEKTYPGMGIGLFLSQEIISRHNGKLWVESVKGRGATFYFSLPLRSGSKNK